MRPLWSGQLVVIFLRGLGNPQKRELTNRSSSGWSALASDHQEGNHTFNVMALLGLYFSKMAFYRLQVSRPFAASAPILSPKGIPIREDRQLPTPPLPWLVPRSLRRRLQGTIPAGSDKGWTCCLEPSWDGLRLPVVPCPREAGRWWAGGSDPSGCLGTPKWCLPMSPLACLGRSLHCALFFNQKELPREAARLPPVQSTETCSNASKTRARFLSLFITMLDAHRREDRADLPEGTHSGVVPGVSGAGSGPLGP